MGEGSRFGKWLERSLFLERSSVFGAQRRLRVLRMAMDPIVWIFVIEFTS